MASFRYFADINGEAVELQKIRHDGHVKTTVEHFSGFTPSGHLVKATRQIEFKSNPSRHACDSRCLNATGRIMKCECACGGKNHGRGAFACLPA